MYLKEQPGLVKDDPVCQTTSLSSVQTFENIELCKSKWFSDKNLNTNYWRQSVGQMKVFNTGYCKFEDQCKNKHSMNICMLTLCQDKSCQKVIQLHVILKHMAEEGQAACIDIASTKV